MRVKKYTNETLILDALNYSSRGEWQKHNTKYYMSAYKRGILNECCAHMTYRGAVEKWTLEVCKQKAKKFANFKQWKKYCPGSYSKASRKNWLYLCYEIK